MVHKKLDEQRQHTPDESPKRFRVDLLMNLTGTYTEYTSRKQLINEAFARSLAEHLRRGGTGGRIVEIETWKTPAGFKSRREKIIEQWDPKPKEDS
jgi:hypothetical protein